MPGTASTQKRLREAIKRTRRELLDVLEATLGDHPKWILIRSRVLRAFGREGLEGLIGQLEEEKQDDTTYDSRWGGAAY